ncbi:MAG: hypothetical protein HC906_09205 [Bacteroidales bacterium]|nr:hypothetical protein [Bacteroidales bacterium]
MIHILNEYGRVLDYEMSLINSKGKELTVLASIEVLANGHEKTLLTTIQDITDRKKMELDLDYLARFPEENPNPVLRIDKNGIIIYRNQASNDLIHYWNTERGQKIPAPWDQKILNSSNNEKQKQF